VHAVRASVPLVVIGALAQRALVAARAASAMVATLWPLRIAVLIGGTALHHLISFGASQGLETRRGARCTTGSDVSGA
jgi:hypothetical protein